MCQSSGRKKKRVFEFYKTAQKRYSFNLFVNPI